MNHIFRSDLPFTRRRLLLAGGLLALGALAQGRRALAAPATMSMDMSEHEQHAHHHAQVPDAVKRSVAAYTVPELMLVRQDGAKVEFPQELDDGHPVILDFVYTSCTSVCPVTSQVFSHLQDKLGPDRERVHMVSISIDPEYDTPARLTEYAKKYHAGPEWQHYTGTKDASIAMQKAFDVYRGDKMDHFPVTFLRAAPGQPWVRLEGFATPDMLVRAYHDLIKQA